MNSSLLREKSLKIIGPSRVGIVRPLRRFQDRTRSLMRNAGVGTLTGLISGFLVLGIGGRIVMRIIAVSAGKELEFSIGGTIFVLIALTFMNVPFGVLFGGLRNHLPGPGLMKGICFGILHLLVLAVIVLLQNNGMGELASHPVLGGTLFSALYIINGVFVQIIYRWARQSLPDPRRTVWSIIGYGFLMIALGFGLFINAAFLFNGGS